MSKEKVLAILSGIDLYLEDSLVRFSGEWTSTWERTSGKVGVILEENDEFILNTANKDWLGDLLSEYIEATQPNRIKVLVDFILENHPDIKEKYIKRDYLEVIE